MPKDVSRCYNRDLLHDTHNFGSLLGLTACVVTAIPRPHLENFSHAYLMCPMRQ